MLAGEEVPVDDEVESLLAAAPPARREDARALALLMARATGDAPRAHGTIIGYGRYRYRYASGREGETFRVGFAPRAAALVLYLPGEDATRDRLVAALGPLKTGAGCVYVPRLADVDAAALEAAVAHVHANPPYAA